MKEFSWVDLGETYVATVQLGRAIIAPIDPYIGEKHYRYPGIDTDLYRVRLETLSGTLIADETLDFEGCKKWAQVNLPLLDLVFGKLGGCGNVLETLEMAQRLLSTETDAIYWLSIERIKKWMAQYTGQTYEIRAILLPEHPLFEFDWIEDGKQFYEETPYGRMVITETRDRTIIGGGIRHTAQIVHHSGAVLNGGSFIDFVEAEAEIKRRLRMFDLPHLELENVDFILDICEKILPLDTDPIHYARLGMLVTYIHYALD